MSRRCATIVALLLGRYEGTCNTMSTKTVPQWDLADRLRKSLREADIGVQEMADYLEVGRNTVSNWINGRTRPPGAALRLWAMRCEVSVEWLRGGDAPPATGRWPTDSAAIAAQDHMGRMPIAA